MTLAVSRGMAPLELLMALQHLQHAQGGQGAEVGVCTAYWMGGVTFGKFRLLRSSYCGDGWAVMLLLHGRWQPARWEEG
jgi:hypothetical protein